MARRRRGGRTSVRALPIVLLWARGSVLIQLAPHFDSSPGAGLRSKPADGALRAKKFAGGAASVGSSWASLTRPRRTQQTHLRSRTHPERGAPGRARRRARSRLPQCSLHKGSSSATTHCLDGRRSGEAEPTLAAASASMRDVSPHDIALVALARAPPWRPRLHHAHRSHAQAGHLGLVGFRVVATGTAGSTSSAACASISGSSG